MTKATLLWFLCIMNFYNFLLIKMNNLMVILQPLQNLLLSQTTAGK